MSSDRHNWQSVPVSHLAKRPSTKLNLPCHWPRRRLPRSLPRSVVARIPGTPYLFNSGDTILISPAALAYGRAWPVARSARGDARPDPETPVRPEGVRYARADATIPLPPPPEVPADTPANPSPAPARGPRAPRRHPGPRRGPPHWTRATAMASGTTWPAPD